MKIILIALATTIFPVYGSSDMLAEMSTRENTEDEGSDTEASDTKNKKKDSFSQELNEYFMKLFHKYKGEESFSKLRNKISIQLLCVAFKEIFSSSGSGDSQENFRPQNSQAFNFISKEIYSYAAKKEITKKEFRGLLIQYLSGIFQKQAMDFEKQISNIFKIYLNLISDQNTKKNFLDALKEDPHLKKTLHEARIHFLVFSSIVYELNSLQKIKKNQKELLEIFSQLPTKELEILKELDKYDPKNKKLDLDFGPFNQDSFARIISYEGIDGDNPVAGDYTGVNKCLIRTLLFSHDINEVKFKKFLWLAKNIIDQGNNHEDQKKIQNLIAAVNSIGINNVLSDDNFDWNFFDSIFLYIIRDPNQQKIFKRIKLNDERTLWKEIQAQKVEDTLTNHGQWKLIMTGLFYHYFDTVLMILELNHEDGQLVVVNHLDLPEVIIPSASIAYGQFDGDWRSGHFYPVRKVK